MQTKKKEQTHGRIKSNLEECKTVEMLFEWFCSAELLRDWEMHWTVSDFSNQVSRWCADEETV